MLVSECQDQDKRLIQKENRRPKTLLPTFATAILMQDTAPPGSIIARVVCRSVAGRRVLSFMPQRCIPYCPAALLSCRACLTSNSSSVYPYDIRQEVKKYPYSPASSLLHLSEVVLHQRAWFSSLACTGTTGSPSHSSKAKNKRRAW